MSTPGPSDNFPQTHWTLVARAASRELNPAAFEALLRQYSPALRGFLIRSLRLHAHEADDLVQGFIASRLLEKNILEQASPVRGRLRSFLAASLRNYVIDAQRQQTNRRRVELGSASLTETELAFDPALFDVEWARTLLDRTVVRMRDHFERTGQHRTWLVFEARILTPTLQGTPAPAYEHMVARFGFETATEACSAVTTAKRAFGRFLREAIQQTVGTDADIDDEIRTLREILGRSA
jgi:DNA-directed RNA polymerase specialized sigma24 family protein